MENEKLAHFIKRNRIHMTAKLVDGNPNISDMPAGSAHWKVTLRCQGRQMSTYFSQGPAICREPEAADVLDCLASDASGIESASSFEDWAGEYGYDTDSRKAEKIFHACEAGAEKLRKLLGEQYEQLLWHTERL